MSGIAGFLLKDGRLVDPTEIQRMVSVIKPRGPDASGDWSAGTVALGHCMLWTTPESRIEEQPVIRGSGDLVLVADTRIDNRDELFASLECEGPLSEIGDAELILRAYEKWGESCPENLVGDFAFAIWDDRRKRLFLARDHLGARPVYYTETEHRFAFASEIKGLLAAPETPRKLNLERIADYLAGTFEDKSNTFYKDIWRLPPGHSLNVHSNGVQLRRYWTLDGSNEIRLESDADYDSAFCEIFFEAVRCRLRSASAPGFLMSGGLDSSSLLAAARQLNRDNPACSFPVIKASFPDFHHTDEDSFFEEMTRGGDVDSHIVRLDRIDPFEGIDQAFERQDEPFHTPNWFVHHGLIQAASKEGVRVLIDGVDGDTTISHGFEFLTELFFRGRWLALADEIAWLSRRLHQPRLRFLKHYGFKPILQRIQWLWTGRLRRNFKGIYKVPAFVLPEFAQRIGWVERYRTLLEDRMRPAKSLREEHERSLSSGIVPFYLETLDKASAGFGIDHRHPYFDRRLVEFCLALPPEQKLHRGWDRAIQRRALSPFLPKSVSERLTKANWRRMFETSLFTHGRENLDEIIVRNPGPIEEFVDIRKVQRLYKACQNDPQEQHAVNFWVISTLALWLRKVGHP
jgi:asparagine synthase (glutamine-hydrolysing)